MIGTNNTAVIRAQQIAGGIQAIVEELKRQETGNQGSRAGRLPTRQLRRC